MRAQQWINPVTPEAEWRASLERLPAWNVPTGPMLIVAPHPDDEVLGVGGLIAMQRMSGGDVVVAAVTDGENCYPGVSGLGEIRREEQAGALHRLGVDRESIVRLGFPDSSVASREDELVNRLMLIASHDTHIVAPWPGDFHPDHEACGRAATEVARRTGAALSFYFFWTWHRATVELVSKLPLRSLPLDRDVLLAKTEALLHHRSQLAQEGGDPILPELLLAPARRSYEVFLPA